MSHYRPSWNQTFIDICDVLRNRSTCQRLKTAAILVKDRNIISIGYNGTPIKRQHCNVFWINVYNHITDRFLNEHERYVDELDIKYVQRYVDGLDIELKNEIRMQSYDEFINSDIFRQLHTEWARINEIHGEVNALLQCDTSTTGSTMYTYYSPCSQCVKSIIAAQIKSVYYKEVYARDMTGIELLRDSGVNIYQI